MTTFVLDASVVLAAFDADDAHHLAARRLLATEDDSLATLDLARFEISNVAVRAWRVPDSVPVLLAVIERIAEDGGVLISDQEMLINAAELAEDHSISVYDAAYVVAARRGRRQLVSCDNRDLVSNDLAVTPAEALA